METEPEVQVDLNQLRVAAEILQCVALGGYEYKTVLLAAQEIEFLRARRSALMREVKDLRQIIRTCDNCDDKGLVG